MLEQRPVGVVVRHYYALSVIFVLLLLLQPSFGASLLQQSLQQRLQLMDGYNQPLSQPIQSLTERDTLDHQASLSKFQHYYRHSSKTSSQILALNSNNLELQLIPATEFRTQDSLLLSQRLNVAGIQYFPTFSIEYVDHNLIRQLLRQYLQQHRRSSQRLTGIQYGRSLILALNPSSIDQCLIHVMDSRSQDLLPKSQFQNAVGIRRIQMSYLGDLDYLHQINKHFSTTHQPHLKQSQKTAGINQYHSHIHIRRLLQQQSNKPSSGTYQLLAKSYLSLNGISQSVSHIHTERLLLLQINKHSSGMSLLSQKSQQLTDGPIKLVSRYYRSTQGPSLFFLSVSCVQEKVSLRINGISQYHSQQEDYLVHHSSKLSSGAHLLQLQKLSQLTSGLSQPLSQPIRRDYRPPSSSLSSGTYQPNQKLRQLIDGFIRQVNRHIKKLSQQPSSKPSSGTTQQQKRKKSRVVGTNPSLNHIRLNLSNRQQLILISSTTHQLHQRPLQRIAGTNQSVSLILTDEHLGLPSSLPSSGIYQHPLKPFLNLNGIRQYHSLSHTRSIHQLVSISTSSGIYLHQTKKKQKDSGISLNHNHILTGKPYRLPSSRVILLQSQLTKKQRLLTNGSSQLANLIHTRGRWELANNLHSSGMSQQIVRQLQLTSGFNLQVNQHLLSTQEHGLLEPRELLFNSRLFNYHLHPIQMSYLGDLDYQQQINKLSSGISRQTRNLSQLISLDNQQINRILTRDGYRQLNSKLTSEQILLQKQFLRINGISLLLSRILTRNSLQPRSSKPSSGMSQLMLRRSQKIDGINHSLSLIHIRDEQLNSLHSSGGSQLPKRMSQLTSLVSQPISHTHTRKVSRLLTKHHTSEQISFLRPSLRTSGTNQYHSHIRTRDFSLQLNRLLSSGTYQHSRKLRQRTAGISLSVSQHQRNIQEHGLVELKEHLLQEKPLQLTSGLSQLVFRQEDCLAQHNNLPSSGVALHQQLKLYLNLNGISQSVNQLTQNTIRLDSSEILKSKIVLLRSVGSSQSVSLYTREGFRQAQFLTSSTIRQLRRKQSQLTSSYNQPTNHIHTRKDYQLLINPLTSEQILFLNLSLKISGINQQVILTHTRNSYKQLNSLPSSGMSLPNQKLSMLTPSYNRRHNRYGRFTGQPLTSRQAQVLVLMLLSVLQYQHQQHRENHPLILLTSSGVHLHQLRLYTNQTGIQSGHSHTHTRSGQLNSLRYSGIQVLSKKMFTLTPSLSHNLSQYRNSVRSKNAINLALQMMYLLIFKHHNQQLDFITQQPSRQQLALYRSSLRSSLLINGGLQLHSLILINQYLILLTNHQHSGVRLLQSPSSVGTEKLVYLHSQRSQERDLLALQASLYLKKSLQLISLDNQQINRIQQFGTDAPTMTLSTGYHSHKQTHLSLLGIQEPISLIHSCVTCLPRISKRRSGIQVLRQKTFLSHLGISRSVNRTRLLSFSISLSRLHHSGIMKLQNHRQQLSTRSLESVELSKVFSEKALLYKGSKDQEQLYQRLKEKAKC